MASHPRQRFVYVIVAFILIFTAACGGLPPIFPGAAETQPASTAPLPAAGDVQASSPVSGTTSMPENESMTDSKVTPAPMATSKISLITGDVTYPQRIALQPDAVIEVELQDVSRADAPAIVVGKQRIETRGAQVPISFAVDYDPAAINPAYTYSLRARIIEGGLVTWLTTNAPHVLTRGAPSDEVTIMVEQSKNPQPAGGSTVALTGVVTYLQRVALSPDAAVEVKLEDVSLADAPATLIASQTIETQGKQVPISYSLEYDPAKIHLAARYAVSARITEGGKLTWISTTMNPVLTLGAPKDNVEIIVQRVGSN